MNQVHDLDGARKWIDVLTAENEELRERIAMMESEFLGADWQAPAEFGLTLSESRILAALIRSEYATKEMLLSAISGQRNDPPQIKIIDVFVFHIRKKIRPYGIDIKTLWGVGYGIPERAVRAKMKSGWFEHEGETV